MIALKEDISLVGERVLLRPLLLSDADAVFAYTRDPDVTRFLPWDPAPNVDSVRPFLAEQIRRRQRGEALALAMVLRETNAVIGSTDLMKLPGSGLRMWRWPRQAEIGYLLAQPYWGRGLMTEAARLTAAYAFETFGLSRLVGWADAENVRSRRVLEKIGMREQGNELRIVKEERRLYIRYVLPRCAATGRTKTGKDE